MHGYTDQISGILKPVMQHYQTILFAYLFGSYALGEQTTLSDIDIAIYVENEGKISFDETLLFHGDCCRA